MAAEVLLSLALLAVATTILIVPGACCREYRGFLHDARNRRNLGLAWPVLPPPSTNPDLQNPAVGEKQSPSVAESPPPTNPPRAIPPGLVLTRPTRDRSGPHFAALDGFETPADETIPPEGVTQRLTRSTAADGTEEFAGWLRMPFAAGQRTASVHLAFCPPFARRRSWRSSRSTARRPASRPRRCSPTAPRLDLKLHAAADSPTDIVLQFAARLGQ